MNKLEQLHLNAIDNNICPENNYTIILGKNDAASKSAEITEQVAIEFGSFLGKKCNWVNNSYYSYLGKTYTTKQLFQEFLKTKQ